MMSRTPISSTILALSLLVPWNIASHAHAEPSRGTAARSTQGRERIATTPMRAAGARTRSESLAIRGASPRERHLEVEGEVVVRPMTPTQESAAILMRLPPGKRIVHIAGFAGDITAYGDARAAAASGSLQLSADSGLERGIERVRDRVLHRMRALRAAGARIDGFTVEHPTALPQGPFGDMMIAEAVDSAVLEVFPNAQPPLRAAAGDGETVADDVVGAAEDQDAADAATEDEAQVATTADAAASRPDAAGRSRERGGAAQQRAEVPHMETAMEERGIQWDRIMDDTRLGAPSPAARRSR